MSKSATADYLAAKFHVSRATIHQWAHRDGWPHDGRRPRRYDYEAALASATRRGVPT